MPQYSRRGGRPTKLTDDRIDAICLAIEAGYPFKVAARTAGITYTTFKNWYNAGEAAAGRLDSYYGDMEMGRFSRDDEDAPERPRLTPNERRYLAFFERVENSKNALAEQCLLILFNAAVLDKNPYWAEQALRRLHPEIFAPMKVQQELSGPGGGPVEVSSAPQVHVHVWRPEPREISEFELPEEDEPGGDE